MIPAQELAIASPQCPLLVRSNTALGPWDHQLRPHPHHPINPLGLYSSFLPLTSKDFPICDLPSLGPAPGVCEGPAFLSPLYRDKPRPGEEWGEPQHAAGRSRKELLSPTFSVTDEQTEAQRGTDLPR